MMRLFMFAIGDAKVIAWDAVDAWGVLAKKRGMTVAECKRDEQSRWSKPVVAVAVPDEETIEVCIDPATGALDEDPSHAVAATAATAATWCGKRGRGYLLDELVLRGDERREGGDVG